MYFFMQYDEELLAICQTHKLQECIISAVLDFLLILGPEAGGPECCKFNYFIIARKLFEFLQYTPR
jgi:hypothetical protein